MSTGKQESGKQEPWTVLRLLEWTTDFFKRRGSDSPRLDAEVLLAHARGCSRIELYTSFGDEPCEEQRVAFREMVRRRGEGVPVAQLVGYREFYSLRFRVDDRVLIPRPETEHLVIEVLDVAKTMGVTDRPLRVADIGTGSGAIAVTVAKHLAECEVTAVDQSTGALAIAKWNADQHGVDDRVTFVESDLLAAVDNPKTFDIIATNPPYISESEFDDLDPTVRDHEPTEALVSGPKGTEVIERILLDAPERLVAGGRLVIELSPMIADACWELAKANPDYQDHRFIKDLGGHRRILSVQRK